MIIVFYDGQCLFCESWVKTVIRNTKNDICFAPLQKLPSIWSTSLLNSKVPSMVVIDVNKNLYFFNARASIYIMKSCESYIRVIGLLADRMPYCIVNLIYKYIGKYRHRIFGKKSECVMPTFSQRSWFAFSDDEIAKMLTKANINILELDAEIMKGMGY